MIVRGGRQAFAGHRPVGRVEVFVFTKGQFHQRAEGLDEHMRQLQVPKSGPASKLEKSGKPLAGRGRG
jgi:hypothetical protein